MGSDSEYIWNQTSDLFYNFKEVTYQQHSIPSVPDEFRKLNGNAYIPKVFSIGPRHRGRSELQPAEVIKSRCYINSLFNRLPSNESTDYLSYRGLIEDCKEAIISLDGIVRKIYTNDINLDRFELATVMLYDGCFLLELLLSSSDSDSNDTHSTLKGSDEYLLRDLLQLENQIPFVILKTLYNKLIRYSQTQVDDTRNTSIENIRNHALSLFGISHAISSSTNNNNFYNAYHLLDIVYLHVKTEWPEEEEDEEERQHVIDTTEHHGGGGLNVQHLNRCATRLEAAGITIRVRPLNNNNNENSIVAASSSKKRIAFTSTSIFFGFFKHNVKFNKSNGILEIPQLVITPTTELLPIWKNFIAWENHNNHLKRSDHLMGQRSERFLISKTTGRDNVFTSSALLFNDLICCPSDVQLLKNKKIIVDQSSKSNRDLIDLFQSNICGVDRDAIIDPLYSTMFHQLNTYSSPINYVYNLQSFFRRGYNFPVSIVTILTVVQTWYAMVAYYHPK